MARKSLKPREILLLLLIAAAVFAWQKFGPQDEEKTPPTSGTTTSTPEAGTPAPRTPPSRPTPPATTSDRSKPDPAVLGAKKVMQAFRAKRSDVQVEVTGRVVFLFPPDRDGKPHQRFLMEMDNGHTLKIAHNLTLSKPVPLRKGDTVRIYGEYEYNAKGGVVHWTHRDPRGRHPHGWIEHNGKRYE